MDQGFHAKPFRFDRVFSPSPEREGAHINPERLDAAALYAELEALRATQLERVEQARADAFADGVAHARQERDQALLCAIDALHAAWDDFVDTRAAMIDQLAGEAGDLAQAIGEQLAGQALANSPGEAIDAAIGRALQHVARGQEIVIFVHPNHIEDIETRIAFRQSKDRRHLALVVAGDASLVPGDACLRWDGGGLRLDAEARRAGVLAELAALGHR